MPQIYVSSTIVAASLPYDNSVTGFGTGDIQSAFDSLVNLTAGGLKNYTSVSSTTFSSSANANTAITGFSVTPDSGTYACFCSVQTTGTGSGATYSLSIGQGGTVIADSIRTGAVPAGAHVSSLSTLTIAQFNGSQVAQGFINPNGSSLTISNRSLLLIRLGA
jgi:hypothetical protein